MSDEPLIGNLRPELIGSVFGRESRLLKLLRLHTFTSTVRILLLSVIIIPIALAVASFEGVLTGDGTIPSALELMFSPRDATAIELPLLEDPIAIFVWIAALATPLLCYAQISAISRFVAMNLGNIGYRHKELRKTAGAVNRRVERANRHFGIIGRRTTSLAFAIGSAGLSWALLRLVQSHGLLRGWNFTGMSDDDWQHRVYDGWWANIDRHLAPAIILGLLGTYLFYFLLKQLAMGVVFAVFASAARRKGFGVAPCLPYNTDGYWGLRRLRRFMQWTYASAMVHFVTTLGVFVIWLPFGQWTVLAVLLVTLTIAVVVIYPSWIAADSAVAEKILYVRHTINDDTLDWATKESLAARVWESPSLPFRVRSALSAGTFYLLIPLVLAAVSSLLGR